MASVRERQDVTLADNKYTPNDAVRVTSTELFTADDELTRTSTALATNILKVIEQYGLNYEREGKWDGFGTFLPVVVGQVSRGESIKMLLPGFPFKSPNTRDKVLDVLPDLGEELALKHLNGLCENIKAIYEHGAEVHITSDGLVYNDLLGVPDETVWNFGEAVRQITVENGLENLSFFRLWDLLGTAGTWSKEHYLANASSIRQELKDRFGDPQFEADMAKKSSSDMQMTHTKYLEFLKTDLLLNENWLAQSSEEQAITISETAKEMMGRWRAFSAALEATSTEYVRLSIHNSGGKDKLSMALIPQKEKGALSATPWHSVVVAELDGTFRSVQKHTVDTEKYELVNRHERPFFFRARSDVFEWTLDNLFVTFDHIYPTGLLIQPESSTPISLPSLPEQKLRTLSHSFSPIILRGFISSSKDEIFNLETGKSKPAACSVLTLSSDDPDKHGESTHFVSSRLVFRYLPFEWPISRLLPVKYSIVGDSPSSDPSTAHPLVITHPITHEPCLRYPMHSGEVQIDNEDQSLVDVIKNIIRDKRAGLTLHTRGSDVLVFDQVSCGVS